MRGADEFLNAISERESAGLRRLFDDDTVTCETRSNQLLAHEGLFDRNLWLT